MKKEIQNKDLMHRAVRHLLVTDDDVMNEAERIVGHTLQRENQGDNGCLTHDRLFIYYSKDGKKKRQTYLVWTPKGLAFIRKLIQGKGNGI
jgi:hypothetical protein